MWNKTIVILIFFHVLSLSVNAQHCTEFDLLFDYKTNLATAFQLERPSELHQILENISTTSEVKEIELIAQGEFPDVRKYRLLSMIRFFQQQGISLEKIKITNEYGSKEQAHVIVCVTTISKKN